MSYELGIIGAGNMAEAIARGVIRAGLLTPAQIIAADVSPERRALFESDLKIKTTLDNRDVVRDTKTVLLAVKPQQMAGVLASLKIAFRPNALVVSIAAGISTGFVQQHLGAPARQPRVVRAMPNTPMLVGEGMVALSRGAYATEADVATARRLFQAAAAVIEVADDKMDAVTALSGSGPAYVFFLVEQMIRAGVEMGLTPRQAHELATKTAYGAAKMLMVSAEPAQVLRGKVTSPGGTTHAAITHMESQNLPGIIVDALKAAEQRGRELGQ
jgi:pyrroline-5-carboxylate reductase